MTGLCGRFGWIPAEEHNPDLFAIRVVIVTVVVTAIWGFMTWLTGAREPSPKTIAFYQKLRVAGPGWSRVAKLAGIEPQRGEFARGIIAWVLSMAWLYSMLISMGMFLFQQWVNGGALLAVSIITGVLLRWQMARGDLLGMGAATAGELAAVKSNPDILILPGDK
jgi:hypothetical protein